jgi:hypothetical protein
MENNLFLILLDLLYKFLNIQNSVFYTIIINKKVLTFHVASWIKLINSFSVHLISSKSGSQRYKTSVIIGAKTLYRR